MDYYAPRRDRLRRLIHDAGADALLVTSFTNVTYLTGFTGDDSYLLVRQDGEVLISDPRYTTQLEEECPGLELLIRPPGTTMLKAIGKVARSAKIGRLGIEGSSMTVGLHGQIAAELPTVELVTTDGLVEQLRQIKDKMEIDRFRDAIRMAEKGFEVLRSTLRKEKTEKQIAAELELAMRQFGAKGCAFPSIVAVGPRAALPHATPTDATVGASNHLLVDWGAHEGMYRSDLTRVLITGKISPKLRKVYDTVLNAQVAAIKAVRPGIVAEKVDAVARNIIAKAGFGRYFGHGLGHGLGLDIHEAPRLAVGNQTVLQPGMVVTVEPGIYLPGWGGVRIEDDILVTKTGYEVLTSVNKSFEEAIVDC
ncbi:MAG TPA: aminopeptidase P family protein [Planctomycetaceae bacterium]|nr:aminopeptidase P family protein [Planctomycetaceae bacterium]